MASFSEIVNLKEKGNKLFKSNQFTQAEAIYSQALSSLDRFSEPSNPIRYNLLANRAACYLRQNLLQKCIEDCSEIISSDDTLYRVKALYRRAQALSGLQRFRESRTDLTLLLKLEPKNSDALSLMKDILIKMDKVTQATDVHKLLESIKIEDRKSSLLGVKGLIDLCHDDSFHSVQFGKLQGTCKLAGIINSYSDDEELMHASLKLFAAITQHAQFVSMFTNFSEETESLESKELLTVDSHDQLRFCSILNLFRLSGSTVRKYSMVVLMNILKNLPVLRDESNEASSGIDSDMLFLNEALGAKTICCFMTAIRESEESTFSFFCDSFSAFISNNPNYLDSSIPKDIRLESLEERKSRARKENSLALRSKTHSRWALQQGILEVLLPFLDGKDFDIRSVASSTMAKVINNFGDQEEMKSILAKLLRNQMKEQRASTYRQLMKLESCLLQAIPDLGVWVLNEFQMTDKLLWLINSQEDSNIEVATEVVCLAANSDSSAPLLQPLMEQNVLTSLLHHENIYVQSNVASALTKLSIKAKALTEDSEENGAILNTIRRVLKTSSNSGLIDNLSIERGIETLAALVSKSYIKDEIVFGSNRCVSCIEELLNLSIPENSTANYGLAHILAALTVTNRELKAAALADKEMTLEQYEQLQELNRIKIKEEQGDSYIDNEEKDLDTPEICKRRIIKIASSGGIKCLIRLAGSNSSQVKQAACRSLRQICVVESIRGVFLQEGGLKICAEISNDKKLVKLIRFEAAHAIAKALVTTNPNLLSEHSRLNALRPLLLLCRSLKGRTQSDVDASQLQQFEGLLALTNLLSCGEAEQNLFVGEKGIQSVHYLMFSNNVMVRRAATETLCNLALHEAMIKVLSDEEKLKLWLAFAEDWIGEDVPSESFLTARAAIGTLAMACSDELVAKAMAKADCMRTFRPLLSSQNAEIIHRVLVAVVQLLEVENEGVTQHLIEGGIVPALQTELVLNQKELNELAKEIAMKLVKYSKKEDINEGN